MALPCLALIAWGFGLQKTQRPFALTAEEIAVAPADAATKAQGYDTTVTFWMRPQGDWPEDLQRIFLKPNWLRGTPTPFPAGSGQSEFWKDSFGVALYYRKNGKRSSFHWPRGAKTCLVSGPLYDAASDLFYAKFSLNLKDVPQDLGTLTSEIKAGISHTIFTGTGRPTSTNLVAAHFSVIVRP